MVHYPCIVTPQLYFSYVNLALDHLETIFGMHLICNKHVTNDKFIAYSFK